MSSRLNVSAASSSECSKYVLTPIPAVERVALMQEINLKGKKSPKGLILQLTNPF
jgi:hypothetical protein